MHRWKLLTLASFALICASFVFADDDSGISPQQVQTVQEADGSPVCNAPILEVSNATLTDNSANGKCTITNTGGSGNSFETVSTPAGTSPVADSSTDTLTLTSTGGTVTITGTAATDTINLEASAGSGDVSAVGDCSTGACFNGSSGTLLTFEKATGDVTFGYVGVTDDFEMTNDLNLYDVEPHLSFYDTTANADDFHFYADGNQFYLTRLNSAELLRIDQTGEFHIQDDLDVEDATPHIRWVDTTANHRDFETYADAGQWYLTDYINGTELIRFDASNNLFLRGTGTTYRWPVADGSSGQFIKTDGSGTLSFAAGGGNSFETISVPAGTSPVADSATDTLAITETSPLVVTGTAATDTIDITWSSVDLGADGTIQADAVALTTDTTGNYALGDAEAGAATTGDTATAFFSVGTIEHERGGLEADVSAYDGLIGITGGATYNQTGTTTQIIIFDGAGAPTSAALSGDATMTNGGVVTVADNSHTHDATTLSTDSVSADELNATGVEAELETTLDIGGEVTSTGMASTVVADSLAVSSWNLTTPTITTHAIWTAADNPTTDADGEIALDTDGWGTGFDALEIFNGTASAYIPAITASDTCNNGEVPKFQTGGEWICAADADSGGVTAINALGDAAADGAVNLLDWAQVWSANTNDVTAITEDIMTIDFTNDAATDILVQRMLVLNNLASTNGVEAALVIKNTDTDDVMTDGILFDAAAGAITDAIDAADPEIGTALRVDANDIVGTTGLINYTEFDVEADGDIVATDITLEGGDLLTGNIALRLGDATTDTITLTTDSTGDGEVVLPNASVGAAELAAETLPYKEFWFPCSAMLPIQTADAIAPIGYDAGTNIDQTTCAMDADLDVELRTGHFKVPSDVASGTVTIRWYWYSAAATTGDAVVILRHNSGTAGDIDPDVALTTITQTDTTAGTAGMVSFTTQTETIANLGWAANDLVYFEAGRDGNAAGDTLAGDLLLIGISVDIPRS